MYVKFMKKFFLANSGEKMGVIQISVSWEKTFDSFFLDMMYVVFMKKFLLADSCDVMSVRLISFPEPKNVWFLLYRHHVRQIHEKIFSGRLERTDGC